MPRITAELEWCLRQHVPHDERSIVIAGQAVDGQAEAPCEFTEALIPGPGLVLHEIAGCQDDVRSARIGQCVLQSGYESVIGIHTTHAHVAMRMKVRIGDVEDAERLGHCKTIAVVEVGWRTGFADAALAGGNGPDFATTVAFTAPALLR